ncbi:MAG: hypothetical protein LBF88_12985 [Planctomycetaceae bacterium]|nr:hypothetical protein [Planctomycetaceae bacterium]
MRMKLGDVRAKKLTMRLDQLEAVSCLDRLRNVAGDWHELTQNRKGQIAAGIGQPYRIIVMPTQDPPPTKPDDGLD